MRKRVIGVMGASANDGLASAQKQRLQQAAVALGEAIADADCLLVTGATTGLPEMVATAFRKRGGFAIGISPAENSTEHVQRYGLPDDGADVMVYTGFGYKGRNVINIRSSDIVIIFGGATGTLNEFTIAYDEGKVIGVLEGSGGIADHIKSIVEACQKSTGSKLFFDSDPKILVQVCLNALTTPAHFADRGVK
jgi:uncharacterized protein (TIGR00725 family)